MGREDRPTDDQYYELTFRGDLFSQGDLFAEVPRTYAALAEEVTVEGSEGGRRFLSGPLEPGFAVLLTPSCSMGGACGRYSHSIRTLAPLIPVQALLESEVLNPEQLNAAKRHDGLINYMFMPGHVPSEMPHSLMLLYMPFTIEHKLLMRTSRRVAQLTQTGMQQLQRKLVWFWSGFQLDRAWLQPPLD